MTGPEILASLRDKGADLDKLIRDVEKNPRVIPALIEGLSEKKGTLKFGAEKVLRLLSEANPRLVYPHFDTFAALLAGDNKILKWGAIITLSHLAAADTEGRFKKIFKKYYAPIAGPELVTAANIIGSSPRIAAARPEFTQQIVREILKVGQAEYQRQGQPSPECKNVALGAALNALGALYPSISRKAPVKTFIQNQRQNSRPSVRKTAEKLLKTIVDRPARQEK